MTSTQQAVSAARRGIRVVRTRDELRVALADLPRPIGLVPTMGWLHAGHRSLIERARADNAATVATIFVNPRQFNEAADYQRYPRNEARDIAICAEEGVDLVFAPDVDGGLPAGVRHDRHGRRRSRGRSRGRRGPATSTGSRPWWRSCST